MRHILALILLCALPFAGHSQLSLSITGHDALCNGSTSGSAKVIATGGAAPYTYAWAPITGSADSISGLTAGTYSVTVTDNNGITATTQVTIGQPTPLTISIDSIVVFPCFKPTGGACGTCANMLWAIVSGGTPPYSYYWTPGGATTDTLSGACYVMYTVLVTDHNGCTITDSLNITIPAFPDEGVTQTTNNTTINIYPNPATTQLTITGPLNNITLFNTLGQQVYTCQYTNSNKATVDVSSLPTGIYLLRVNKTYVQKFLKQ
jgi:hypothetical protein